MIEIWKPVVGFEGRYEISNMGSLMALDREIIYRDGRIGKRRKQPVKGAINKYGYRVFTFDSTVRKMAHRVVAEAFFIPDGKFHQTINHKDGNKLNNCVGNLEWATYAENNFHARVTGLQDQYGESCNLTKYSEQLVTALKNVHAKYHPTYKELSDMFGISAYHIGEIIRKESRAKR